MRFTAAALRDRERSGDVDLGLARAQHEVRGRLVRALPARAALRVQGRPGGAAGSCRAVDGGRARCEAQARGVEVRVVRRLPALAAGLRGRAARRWPTRSRSPTSWKRPGRRSKDPTTSRSSRVRSPRRTTPQRIREIRARSRRLDHDRRVRDRRRHPGAAQLRRRRRLRRGRLRDARVHLDARATRPVAATTCMSTSSSRAARSDKRQLLEVISAFLNGRRPAIASHSVCIECKRARQRVRDGRPRHALPRARHARRLRGALPHLPPRLLRLLRADGGPERCARWPAGSRTTGDPDVRRRLRLFYANAPGFREDEPWTDRRVGGSPSRARARRG